MRRPHLAASDERLNIVVILTDDQSFDTFPSYPPALPWLQSQVQDPDGHWLWFPDAFIQTPLCCPSRATILSGLDSRHTHVRTNDDGARFDDTQTIATWLHGAGYFTGLIGKYLNRYPFGRGPYIPPGWDRWVVKRNTAATTTYSNFGFVDQGVALQTSDAPATYATDLFAGPRRRLPADRAGRPSVLPVLRDERAASAVDPALTSRRRVRRRPRCRCRRAWSSATSRTSRRGYASSVRSTLRSEQASSRIGDTRLETLLGVDDAVERIVEQLRASGELEHTVILFLTDNGYSFGQHRIRGKRCQYEECIRTPFAARVPGAQAHDVPGLISNVDLAPTIADLAGVEPGQPVDGRSFASALPRGAVARTGRRLPGLGGDREIPAWQGVRTVDFAYHRERGRDRRALRHDRRDR